MSSNGRCFDIGIATRGALQRFQRDGNPLAGSTDPNSAGNGCIMRLAPVPIRYMDQPEEAIRLSEEQARTTHQAPECLGASRLFGSSWCEPFSEKPRTRRSHPMPWPASCRPSWRPSARAATAAKAEIPFGAPAMWSTAWKRRCGALPKPTTSGIAS